MKTVANLLPALLSPSSSKTAAPTSSGRTLPVKFVEGFLTDGPGWNAAEKAQATVWRDAAREMVADMRDNEAGWPLTFLGQTASGKTMLGRAVLRYARNLAVVKPTRYTSRQEPPPGPSVIYWPQHDWREVDELTSATFLLLDEIGRGERGGKEWQRLMDLLNFRIERRLFTVVTANLTWAELKSIDAAIASRLQRNGGKVFQSGAAIRPFEERR